MPLRQWMICLAAMTCLVVFPGWSQEPDDQPTLSWADRAAAAHASLLQRFAAPQSALFLPSFPSTDPNPHLQYWWQAHAIDALVDAFERTGDPEELTRARDVWQAVKKRNQGVTNDFYDDMEWMALALLRLERHLDSPELFHDVQTLWNDIQTGWNDEQGGGIAWRKSQRGYKNAPANAPAVILACRMYARSADPDDLACARRIYAWLDQHLVDPQTDLVWDGVNRRGDGAIDKTWMFTYNQGLRIGAALELHKATGEAQFLDDAGRTFAATRERLTDEHGVLRERGRGDGGLFKGVLVRYVGALASSESERSQQARAFLKTQAEAAWEHVGDPDHPLFGPIWTAAAREPVELSTQLSGVMLMEQMAKLDRVTPSVPSREQPGSD